MYISATVSAFLDTAKTESSVLFSPYKALGAWNLRTYFYPGPISPGSKITDLRHNYLEKKKKKGKEEIQFGFPATERHSPEMTPMEMYMW